MSGSHDIPRIGEPIDWQEAGVFDTLDNLLIARNALQGFTEARWRVMAVFDNFDPDFGGRVLGYGRGHTAEEALVRAVYTWAKKRPREGQVYIGADDFPESTHSHISPELRGRSLFDYIVKRGDFWLRTDNGKYTAGSDRGAGIAGKNELEARGVDSLNAIEELAVGYNFGFNEEIEHLPLTLFSETEHSVMSEGRDDGGSDNGA